MRRLTFIAVVCLVLSACGGGGGGGGGGTSINVSVQSVHLTGYRNFPNFAEQEVSVTFVGEGVVVGTPPGQALPSWLSVFQLSVTTGTPNQAIIRIQAVPHSQARGTYTQTLRFVTGKANGTAVKSVDVTVTFDVVDVIDVNLVDDFPEFLEFDGDPAGARAQNSARIRITGDTAWRAVVSQPWASLSATSGTGARDLQVSVTRSGLPLGSRQALISVFDDVKNRRFDFAIDYTIRPARLTVSANSLTFNLNSQTLAADLARTLVVSDEINGAVPAKGVSWSATIDDPWVRLSASSGTSAPARTLTAQVGARVANFIGSGTRTTNINFAYVDSGGNPGTLQVPVTLQVRLPVARALTPYFIPPNTAATLRVRGEDIRAEDMTALSITPAIAGASFARVDATRLTLTLPPLPAGEYELRFANAAGLTRSGATVVVGTAPAVGAGVIESPHPKRLMFDAQRGRLFAVDRADNEIETYTWNGSAWVAGPSLVVPEVTDVALARSGKDLVVMKRAAIEVGDANDPAAARSVVWQQPASSSYMPALNALVLNDQDIGLLAQTYYYAGVSSHTPVSEFDALAQLMLYPVGSRWYYGAELAGSGDGRYVMFGETGISSPDRRVWDSFGAGPTLLGSFADTEIVLYSPTRTLDYAGTRMVEGSYAVRDVNANYLGKLDADIVAPDHNFAVLSLDGARVFMHKPNRTGGGGPGVVDVYDLTATPAQPSLLYPVIGSVPMPARIVDPTTSPGYPGHPIPHITGQAIDDGRFAVLAGPERMVVVDVSAF